MKAFTAVSFHTQDECRITLEKNGDSKLHRLDLCFGELTIYASAEFLEDLRFTLETYIHQEEPNRVVTQHEKRP